VGYLFSKLSFDDKLRIVVSNRDHVSEQTTKTNKMLQYAML